ncbi:MAG: acetyltransferase [Candidatus Obscuribacterales bacterium]|jgi:acetyltransferase EpsM|nr:acetyltransferase [Candidatus Obscuribacterales bacterium]
MKAVILGAGAQGRVACDLLQSSESEFSEIEFLDDNESLWGRQINGVEVAGSLDRLLDYDKNNFRVLIALGNPKDKERMFLDSRLRDVLYLNIVHSTAYLAPSTAPGAGNTISAQAVVNSNSELSKHILVNTGAIVEHDCRVGDFVTIGPGALLGGRVEVSARAFIASRAVIMARKKIGAGSIVAAGSLVTADVPDNTLVMGVPARVKYEIDEQYDWRRLL